MAVGSSNPISQRVQHTLQKGQGYDKDYFTGIGAAQEEIARLGEMDVYETSKPDMDALMEEITSSLDKSLAQSGPGGVAQNIVKDIARFRHDDKYLNMKQQSTQLQKKRQLEANPDNIVGGLPEMGREGRYEVMKTTNNEVDPYDTFAVSQSQLYRQGSEVFDRWSKLQRDDLYRELAMTLMNSSNPEIRKLIAGSSGDIYGLIQKFGIQTPGDVFKAEASPIFQAVAEQIAGGFGMHRFQPAEQERIMNILKYSGQHMLGQEGFSPIRDPKDGSSLGLDKLDQVLGEGNTERYNDALARSNTFEGIQGGYHENLEKSVDETATDAERANIAAYTEAATETWMNNTVPGRVYGERLKEEKTKLIQRKRELGIPDEIAVDLELKTAPGNLDEIALFNGRSEKDFFRSRKQEILRSAYTSLTDYLKGEANRDGRYYEYVKGAGAGKLAFDRVEELFLNGMKAKKGSLDPKSIEKTLGFDLTNEELDLIKNTYEYAKDAYEFTNSPVYKQGIESLSENMRAGIMFEGKDRTVNPIYKGGKEIFNPNEALTEKFKDVIPTNWEFFINDPKAENGYRKLVAVESGDSRLEEDEETPDGTIYVSRDDIEVTGFTPLDGRGWGLPPFTFSVRKGNYDSTVKNTTIMGAPVPHKSLDALMDDTPYKQMYKILITAAAQKGDQKSLDYLQQALLQYNQFYRRTGLLPSGSYGMNYDQYLSNALEE